MRTIEIALSYWVRFLDVNTSQTKTPQIQFFEERDQKKMMRKFVVCEKEMKTIAY